MFHVERIKSYLYIGVNVANTRYYIRHLLRQKFFLTQIFASYDHSKISYLRNEDF